MAGAAFLAGAAFFAGDDLALDFAPVFAVDDLEPEPDVLLAVDFEAVPDDLPADVFEAVDLLAEVFEVDEPDFAAPDLAAGFAEVLLVPDFEVVFDELLDEVDFDAVFEPEVLLVEAALVGAAFLFDEAALVGADFFVVDEAALVIADFLFVVVDFVELLVGFLVAIFFSYWNVLELTLRKLG